jgi:hypothetical protein
MLDILGGATQLCDKINRREWLKIGALGPLSLSLPGLLAQQSSAEAGSSGSSTFGRAKRCVMLFMAGGPAQQDTFDMKPDASSEYRSAFSPIATKVAGIDICEHFPHLARHTDKLAFVRSVTHTDNNHSTAAHWMSTGYAHRVSQENFVASRRDHPHIGSVLSKLTPGSFALPKYINLPERSHNDNGALTPGQDGGFLGGVHDPFWVEKHPDDPKFEVPSLRLHDEISPLRLQSRGNLLKEMDVARRQFQWARQVESADTFHQQAFDLLGSSKAHKAFDLRSEAADTRERYGNWAFGQSLLLARRLLEADVKLVTVNWPRHKSPNIFKHWDTHANGFKVLKDNLIPYADRPVATFLDDLDRRGMLEDTLVVWYSEFGRSPKGQHQGHWGPCNTVWFAGAGISAGTVHGSSDKHAAYPATNPVSPADLTATIYHLLGINHHQTIDDPRQRPIFISDGSPIEAII